MTILSIESSCDETSAAVIKDTDVLSNVISSQLFHSKFGGVVPELASRAHLKFISEITIQALKEAELEISNIDALAVTSQPGLIGSLIVGSNFAKGLAVKYNLPIIPVNHIEGHLYSGSLEDSSLEFPYIALVVSGGHTALFHVESFNKYTILGTTIDDAAGEAFDKIANLLELGYPGGPEIDKLAQNGNKDAYKFPRSMINSKDFNFSFSGLKTSFRYYLANNFSEGVASELLPDLCASVQEAIVEVLTTKTIYAANKHKAKSISVSGGVSSNTRLRQMMNDNAKLHGIKVIAPKLSYCTDNAAMIGFIAEKKLEDKDTAKYFNLNFTVSANSFKAAIANNRREDIKKSTQK